MRSGVINILCHPSDSYRFKIWFASQSEELKLQMTNENSLPQLPKNWWFLFGIFKTNYMVPAIIVAFIHLGVNLTYLR